MYIGSGFQLRFQNLNASLEHAKIKNFPYCCVLYFFLIKSKKVFFCKIGKNFPLHCCFSKHRFFLRTHKNVADLWIFKNRKSQLFFGKILPGSCELHKKLGPINSVY